MLCACYGFKSFRTTGSPCIGCSARKSAGACTYSGATSNANHRRINASVAFASSIAKSCPMQDRWPKEKDNSVLGCAVALPTPSRNRSGLNSPASSKRHVLASRRRLEQLLETGEWPEALAGWRREQLEPVLAPLLPERLPAAAATV